MRKIITSLVLLGSIVTIAAPASAADVIVTGPVSAYWSYMSGTTPFCVLIMAPSAGGQFYYSSGSDVMCASLDLARQVKGAVNFRASDVSRQINLVN